MKYVKAVMAALRATASYVAIPVEGHAPACVKAKLLKGALKGVSIHSVKIITADPNDNDSGRWLEVRGMAGNVQTYCKMVVTNRRNHLMWLEMSKWAAKEREKRIKVVSQGALNPAERKALKLKEAMAKEDKRRNAELIAAKREEAEIIEEAKEGVFPEITPKREDERKWIMAEYAEFHHSRPNRKRGSVIRWKLAKLREQIKAMTTEKREYEERPRISPYARRRRVCVSTKRVLRRKGGALKYAALVYQIEQLEKQFAALYPPRRDRNHDAYWTTTFIEKRPTAQAYSVPWNWHDACVPVAEQLDEDGEPYPTRLQRLARSLREARASIRALTPPEDENDDNELPIAA